MMIEVFCFEDADGNAVDYFTTRDIEEARRYAIANGYAIIARIFEYADSELVEDYRPKKKRRRRA
jgi:hypothetical protein